MIQRNSEIVLRQVGDFFFLINPRKSYNSDEEDIFQTNEIGAAIWNLLVDYSDVPDVYNALTNLLNDEIDDNLSKQIYDDVSFFVAQLIKNGYAEEV